MWVPVLRFIIIKILKKRIIDGCLKTRQDNMTTENSTWGQRKVRGRNEVDPVRIVYLLVTDDEKYCIKFV